MTDTRSPRRPFRPAGRTVFCGALCALLAWGAMRTADADEAPPAAAAPEEAPAPATRPATRTAVRLATRPTTRAATRPTRPLKTTAEYEALAASLRESYSKPPAEWPPPTVDAGVEWRELGRLPKVEHPSANPFSPAKAALGERLFFDPVLSSSRQIACASCHDPDLGWADGRTVAFGHGRKALRRNAPSLMNVGLNKVHFWDGRADSLEEQVAVVVLNPEEMDGAEAEIVRRLNASPSYRAAFKEVFGSPEIDLTKVAHAVACFERTLVGGRSRFDVFLAGRPTVLSDEAVRGLHLFRTDARCMNCHHGPTLTDNRFHDVGLSYYGRKLQDLGRYDITRDAKDVGAFRTPTLRNVARTGPYMHNGVFELAGVLNLYNAGMPTLRRKAEQADDPLFPTKSPLLKPLGLNRQDLADLTAFLDALSEPRRRFRPPEAEPGQESAAQEQP